MGCTNGCRLCDRIRISQSVTFADSTLVVNLPAGSYNDDEKYCVVIAQDIPSTATISAPVVFTIGEGTVQYPVIKRDGTPLTASGIRTRTTYPCVCDTTATSAVFRILRRVFNPGNNLAAVNGTAPVAAPTQTSEG